MLSFKLGADEVVLFKSHATFNGKASSGELILTNQNLVVVRKDVKLFSEDVNVTSYPVESIKVYEETPQIKAKGSMVEIYLVETEFEVKLPSIVEVHKLINAANKLLTGKTSAEKGAKKVKETIALVDDTLGIDSVQVTSNALASKSVLGNLLSFTKGKSLPKKKK